MSSDQTPGSPHGDADATDPTMVLANRLHQIISDAGFDCPEDALCWEIAQALVIDGATPAMDTENRQLRAQRDAVLALADALDAEAVDRALGANVERRATKIQVAARIRRALGVEASDGRD